MTAEPPVLTTLGLSFVGDPLPGLVTARGADGLDEVQVQLTDEADVEQSWSRAQEPRLLIVNQYKDGRPFMTVERDPQLGYRVWADQHGTHLVALDGTSVQAAPRPDAPGGPVRLLASQVYPLLTALRGREPLHAGAVVIDGRLIGFAARSGTGKSTTIWHLMGEGARFFSDDVLALEPAGTRVRAHPGPRLINLAHAHLDAGPPAVLIGESEKLHLTPPGDAEPLELAGVVFLERPGGDAAPGIERVTDAARVLAHASLPYLETPERLVRQLDVLAALATTPLARVRAGAGESAGAVAARVREWAAGLG